MASLKPSVRSDRAPEAEIRTAEGRDLPASRLGSFARLALSLPLSLSLLSLFACSTIDASADAQYGDDTGIEGTGSSHGDEEDTGEDDEQNDTETEGTSGSGTEDDADTEEGVGIQDPAIDAAACDPQVAQVFDYDLSEANAEIAPALVREVVLGSGVVPQVPLSPRPFLNHFKYAYEPAQGSELEISGELWKPAMVNVDQPKRYALQFALRGPMMSEQERPAVDLAIVVDLGPSMAGEPLALANEALVAISQALRAGDRVTLIGAGETAMQLGTLDVDDMNGPSLASLLAEVTPGGSSAMADAIGLAYSTFEQPVELAHERVLVLSSGHFLVDDALAQLVADHADEGHYLVGVGVGSATGFAETPLRLLGIQGKGSSMFAPSPEDVWKGLHERFVATLITSAAEVEVRLQLPEGLALRESEVYQDILPAANGLAMLGPNDELVFHHELESCVELPADAMIRVEVEWIDPELGEAKQTIWELPVTELGPGSMAGRKGAATLAYVDALRAYRDNKEPSVRYGALLDALGLISDALAAMPEDPDLIEMSEVLAKLESQ